MYSGIKNEEKKAGKPGTTRSRGLCGLPNNNSVMADNFELQICF